MSISICTACLSRLRVSAAPTRLPVITTLSTPSSFHTSAVRLNVVKKKTTGMSQQVKHREARSARIKRKHKERPKPPPVGERRAQRKRIVLSNTNALPVAGLDYLSDKNMADEAKIGQMLMLEGKLLDQLRDSKAFKTTQAWNMFRQPSTLMRHETVELGADIRDISASRDDQGLGPRTVSKIITGERATGKSMHLLQAMSMGFVNKWICFHVPDAQEFTNNTSSYTPAPEGTPIADLPSTIQEGQAQFYIQPQLTSDVLSRLVQSNGDLLSQLKPVLKHDKSLPIKKSATLRDIAEIGASEAALSTAIFDIVWRELTTTEVHSGSGRRPAILITIDGLNHWMGLSQYRSADYKFIHAHQFTMVRHFLSLLFNRNSQSLPNGGMTLAATSTSNVPTLPTLDLILAQLAATNNAGLQPDHPGYPTAEAFSKLDQRVLDLLPGAKETRIQELKGLSRVESKGLLEYFARSGMLLEKITESYVGEKWSLSGGGVIGELEKLGKRIRV